MTPSLPSPSHDAAENASSRNRSGPPEPNGKTAPPAGRRDEKAELHPPLTLNGWLGQEAARRIVLWTSVLLALCIALGWYFTHLLGHYGETVERRALLMTVSSLVGTFQTEDEIAAVKNLKGLPEDRGTGAYDSVHEELQDIRQAVPGSRFAYLVTVKDGKVIFLADSEAPTSPDYSPPGQVYGEASDALRGVFVTRAPATEGPVVDRWGTWVSGFAPVIDPETGAVIAVLGVDIGAATWESTVDWFRGVGFVVSGIVALVVLISGVFSMRQRWLAAKLAVANRIVENSTAILYRLGGGKPPLPMLFVSANVARIGFEQWEFLQAPTFYLTLVHPDDRHAVEAWLQRLIEGSDVFGHIQYRVRLGDGTYRWFENRMTLHRDEAGRLLFIEGMLVDVDERKRAEDKLADANRIVENSTTLLFRMAGEAGLPLIYVSSNIARLGYDPKELTDSPLAYYSLFHPDDRPRVETELRSLFEGKDVAKATFRVRSKNGEYRWFDGEIRAHRDASGRLLSSEGMLVDITERKQMEERLAIANQIIERSTTIIYRLSGWPDMRLTYVSANVARLGYDQKQFIDSPDLFISLLHPDDRTIIETARQRALTGNDRSIHLQYRIRAKDGSYRWIDDRLAITRDLRGNVVAGEGVMTDVTERKLTEDKLADANRIVENSTTILFRMTPGPPGGLPFLLSFVSGNVERLGYTPNQFTDARDFYMKIVHPDDAQHIEAELRSLLEGAESVHTLGRLCARNGASYWYDGQIKAHRDDAGRLLFVEGMLTDITERKDAEDKLVFANTLLKTQFETSPDGILVVDSNRRVMMFNRRFADIFGITGEFGEGSDDSVALKRAVELSADPKAFLDRILYLYAHPEQSANDEFETKDGRIFERQSVPLRAGDGTVLGRIWIIHDISELRSAERKAQGDLLRSQEQLRTTGEISKSLALLSGDVEALARQVTELASKTIGCERVNVWLFNSDETELHCIDLYEATPDRHSAGMVLTEKAFGPELKIIKSTRYVNADDPLADPRTAGYVEPYLKPLGITSMLDVAIRASEQNFGLLCFEHVGKPHHWTEDEIGYACQLADKIGIAIISGMRRRAEEQIRHSARHDGLTGLANRKVFIETLDQAIARAERSERAFAVLYLDLDHFKDVNDTLGHPVGDELLCAAAERLRGCVRKTDLVARFGGDEFAILSEGVRDPADVANLAAKIIDSLKEPYSLSGNEISSGASVGIAVWEPGDKDPELLLSNADIALYRAKSEERGSYRFFTEAMDTEVRARVTLSAELRNAIEAGELCLDYQPQVELATGRIVGVEALVRWRHPDRGVLGPTEFIPIAEQTGLIVGVDSWVLREACRQGKAWVDEGIAPDTIGLNMSPVYLKRTLEVEQQVLAALSETGLPPERLEIEITESGLMMASREHEAALSRLRDKGIKLAIDDFGTGYSSLDYLRRFPAHRLKIAQVFIAQIVTDPSSEAILRAVVGLSRELGMVSIAEGVETEKQLAVIKACGCPEVQGYYFAKPLSAEDIRPLLKLGKILRPAKAAKTAA